MKFLASLLLGLLIFLSADTQAEGYTLPEFTSCINPQGNLKVSYDSGTHGIAGRTGIYQGKDSVYTISSNSLTQCFCADSGAGIQTNWWKISGLTENEIDILKSQGWIYIPNGKLWGLEEGSYLAKNSDYSCKSSNGNGGQGGSSFSNNGSGNVAGSASAVGSVLGLASTGNTLFVIATALTSGLSLLAGLILKKQSKGLCK